MADEDKLEEFKRQFQNSNKQADLTYFETYYLELKNDLLLKTEQLQIANREMDRLNLKNFELTRSSEVKKAALDEANFNLNLVQNQMRKVEENGQSDRDAVSKWEQKYNMAITENETIRNASQTLQMENLELRRNVENLEMRIKHFSTFHNELLRRDAALKDSMSKLKDSMTELTIEQTKVLEISKYMKLTQDSTDLLEYYKEECSKLKSEKAPLEHELIKLKAKYETLKGLLDETDPALKSNNLTANIYALQWRKNSTYFAEQFEKQNAYLEKMTKMLCSEKNGNKKLILIVEEQKDEIKLLKQQISTENKKTCEVPKMEIVETEEEKTQ